MATACGAHQFSNDSGGSLGEAARAPESAEELEYGDAGGEADEETASGEGSSIGSDIEISDRQLIHTADLTVRVDDVPGASGLAKELTIEAGGYIASERLSTPSPGTPEGSLTLRVPNDGYEDALTDLAELGDRSHLERSVEDVTEEVADVESRIESSETALKTLRGYLEEAEDVDDLLRVESEIQTRQSELEAFQARLKTLADQTAYSTVHLTLRPPETYLEEQSEDGIGFLGGLERGWRALASFGRGVAVAVGWLLPFLVATVVLGAGPLWWYRSRRAGRPAKVRGWFPGASRGSTPGRAEGAGTDGGPTVGAKATGGSSTAVATESTGNETEETGGAEQDGAGGPGKERMKEGG